MSKSVILTTNMKPDYLFCLPITAKTWELQDWDVLVGVTVTSEDEQDLLRRLLPYNPLLPRTVIYPFPETVRHKLNPGLFTQCLRMYLAAGNARLSDYAILGDVDMLLGSSFLNRSFDKVNVFGHDLTGFEHIPMCYVGAPEKAWREIMGKTSMQEDVAYYGRQETAEQAWCIDQDILTGKLKKYGYNRINFINRGTDVFNANLPTGRCDRYNHMRIPKGTINDVHLMREPWKLENVATIKFICGYMYPGENWDWLDSYADNFRQFFNL